MPTITSKLDNDEGRPVTEPATAEEETHEEHAQDQDTSTSVDGPGEDWAEELDRIMAQAKADAIAEAKAQARAEVQASLPDPNDYAPDGRRRLDVANPAEVAQHLRRTLGADELSGIFRRSGELVHTPRIGEEGYIVPDDPALDLGPAQV